MGQVKIATDSTADVPAALALELDIAIVPCQVFWGKDVYLDGVDLPPDAFFERLAHSSELPRTSQPRLSDFVDTYRRLLEVEQNEAVVSIHVAGNLSGTVNAAWAAAQVLPDPSQVEVIDSGQVSMGLGWAVVEAARLARSGGTRNEIARAVGELLPRLRAAAMIDTLENLYKGGRINQVTAALGSMLQIKPLILIQSGQVKIVERVRTRSKALQRLEAMVRDWGPVTEAIVLHTGAQELARNLASSLRDLTPGREMMVGPAGTALASHLGPGAVGACVLLAPDRPHGDG